MPIRKHYAYVGSNPLTHVDPKGLDVWVVNRSLAALPGAPSSEPLSDPWTHTYVVVTNPDGTFNTYSWGADPNNSGWNYDQPLDMSMGQQALSNGNAGWVDSASLDPYVAEAYQDLNDPTFEHRNGWITNNCKTETGKLLDLARYLQAHDRFHISGGNPLMTPNPMAPLY